jgi:hypothetical protein
MVANMNNPPAFPCGEYRVPFQGMTLRDYFAAKAMQGLFSDPEWRIDMDFSDTAHAAYNQADAMLKARNGD